MAINLTPNGLTRWDWIRQRVRGEKIIDIGCGEGLTFRNHPLASRVTGIDLDRWQPPGYGNFVQCNAEDLPFKDGYFDTAVLGEVLEHVVDPVKVLREARRVAKFLWFSTPNEDGWSENAKPKMSRADWDSVETTITTANPLCVGVVDNDITPHLFHIRYWTLDTLRSAFDEAGLVPHIQLLNYKTKKDDELVQWSFFVGYSWRLK